MQLRSRQTSKLNPPENITPSLGMTITGLLVLLPIFLLFLGMFTGVLKL